MKTTAIKEAPLRVLRSWTYDESAELEIFAADLKAVEIGAVLTPYLVSSCGRDCHEEALKVVYKDSSGVAAVLSVSGTTDSPNPDDWREPDELLWFELR